MELERNERRRRRKAERMDTRVGYSCLSGKIETDCDADGEFSLMVMIETPLLLFESELWVCRSFCVCGVNGLGQIDEVD